MKKLRIIGVMSGTSLDGIDLVAVDFTEEDTIKWEIKACSYIPYDDFWSKALREAHQISPTELFALDAKYGEFIGQEINRFILENNLDSIDYIASHGHTIFHQPKDGYSVQIGQGAKILSETQIPVICDFRVQDVALGGQGAPLVPIGDELLFSQYDACVNLGGFANISFNHKNQRIAFDICPLNFVINHFTQQLGFPFDDKGLIAKEYPVDSDLVQRLNAIEFYHASPPKSLGREWVEKEIFPLLNKYHSIEEIIASFTHHAAHQIAIVLNKYKFSSVLFTGGGSRNEELIRKIQSKTDSNIIIGDDYLIDYKEALVFAFLGWLKVNNRVNVLSSVTGAKRNSSSGVLYV